MSKGKTKYTGVYPRKVVATARGLFGRIREVGAVFMIHREEQFSDRWMRDAKKGPVVREEEVAEETLDEGSDTTSEEGGSEEPEEETGYGPEAGDENFSED